MDVVEVDALEDVVEDNATVDDNAVVATVGVAFETVDTLYVVDGEVMPESVDELTDNFVVFACDDSDADVAAVDVCGTEVVETVVVEMCNVSVVTDDFVEPGGRDVVDAGVFVIRSLVAATDVLLMLVTGVTG